MQKNNIQLRALEPEDLEYIYRCENDTTIWTVSETLVPFSMYHIKKYLKEYSSDIYTLKQLRLAIIKQEDATLIGFVDLFNFDPLHQRVGLGILIYAHHERKQGYARTAIELIEEYCLNTLQLHQIYANIPASNIASIKLFESLNYKHTGTFADWLKHTNKYNENPISWEDLLFYQKILY